MKSSNSINLAIEFYKRQTTTLSLVNLMLLVAISGILETLPILASLPLLRAVFLGNVIVEFGSIETGMTTYAVALVVLLVLRFFIGRYAQFANARERINLLTEFRMSSSEEQRKEHKVNFGKSVQGINFLLVGWSQFVPGILFTLLGILLAPKFGIITLGIVVLWAIIIRFVKRNQDGWHKKSSNLANKIDELNTTQLKELQSYRIEGARWDAINKNLREIVIISSLIGSLMINNYLGMSSSFSSLFVVIVFLRGLQQLYTSYIMAQQLAGLKNFLLKV